MARGFTEGWRGELSEEMAVLHHLSYALGRIKGLERALTLVLAEMERRLMLGPSRVYSVMPSGELRLLAEHGLSPDITEYVRSVHMGRGFTGLAAQRGKPVLMPVDQLPDRERGRRLAAEGIKAICAVPLLLDGQLEGVLNVGTRRRVGFTPPEQRFIETLAGPLAAAVAARDLTTRCKEKQEELGQLKDQVEQRVNREIGSAVQELDQLRQANRQLQKNTRMIMQAERTAAVSRFSTVLADKLRNPLMVIGGFAARLMTALGAGTSARNYAKVIAEEVQHLELMLSELFKLHGKRDLEYSSVQPNQVMKEAYDRAVELCGEPQQEPVWELGSDLPELTTDRALLVSCLSELIQNAMEATEGRGRVFLITATGQEDNLEFCVADDGPGIPDHEREKVFDPLYSTKELGSGLGLPLVRDTSDLLGGHLQIGDRLGGGARLVLSLPLKPPPKPG